MKTIHVAAAVIQEGSALLATARGYGEYAGLWEFPGGKIEPGETSADAVIREIKEELDCIIVPVQLITVIEYDYPAFHLQMDCWLCHLSSGTPTALEAKNMLWITSDQLRTLEWLPADMLLIPILEKMP